METVLSKSDFAAKLAATAVARVDGGAEASGAGNGGEGFRPEFAPLSAQQMGGAKTQFRRVSSFASKPSTVIASPCANLTGAVLRRRWAAALPRSGVYRGLSICVDGHPRIDETLVYPPVYRRSPSCGRLTRWRVWRRQLAVPQHRFTPLKESWLALYKPVTEQLKLDMRMNLKTRKVEIKTTNETAEVGFLQKAADFVQAFILGFDVADAIALLRLDDLYLESFEIKDVKVCAPPHASHHRVPAPPQQSQSHDMCAYLCISPPPALCSSRW
jgi:hypothetical protein